MQATPLSVAVKVLPATLAVRICTDPAVLAGIVRVTVPLPVPLEGEAPRPEADQAGQPDAETVTLTGIEVAAGEMEIADGLMAYEQVEPNWVMV